MVSNLKNILQQDGGVLPCSWPPIAPGWRDSRGEDATDRGSRTLLAGVSATPNGCGSSDESVRDAEVTAPPVAGERHRPRQTTSSPRWRSAGGTGQRARDEEGANGESEK